MLLLLRSSLMSFVFVSISTIAFGQQTTGDVVGQITDATGALLPHVTVTLQNTGTAEIRRFETTNGQYAFSLLKLGSYSLTVTAEGFRTERVSSFPLVAGERHRVDLAL